MSTLKLNNKSESSVSPTAAIANLPDNWMSRQLIPPLAATAVRPRRRAAVYLRYSTQAQDPYSFERQLARAKEYAESIGVDIVVVYSDAGESGAYTANRGGFLDMLAAGDRQEFELLIVEDGDRLSRKLHITSATYNRLRQRNIELHSSTVGVWNLMYVAFAGLISEEQRQRIVDLTRSGRVKLVQRALWPGRPPFGYRKVPGKPGEMTVNPEESNVIRRIYSMRLSGLTFQQIAVILHQEGKFLLSPIRVMRILRNPIYVGLLIYFKTKRGKYETPEGIIQRTSSILPTAEWKVSERQDWAIVELGDWQKVQDMDTKHAPGPRSIYLLSAKVYCGACGYRCVASAKKRSGRMSMKCRSNWKIKHTGAKRCACYERGVHLDRLEDSVISAVCERLDMPEALQQMQSAYDRAAKQLTDGLNRDRAKLTAERSRLIKVLDATSEAAMVVGLTTNVVRDQRIRLCQRLDEIDGELASRPLVTTERSPVLSAPLEAASFLSELSPMRNYRNCSEPLAKLRSAFRRLIDKVTVTTNKQTGAANIRIEGPITWVDGKDTIEYSISRETSNGVRLRMAHVDARKGRFALADEDWEKIKDRLPSDPVWSEEFDEPLPFRCVLDALIWLKNTGVGPGNLDGSFGPKRQVWSALRMLSFAGILDRVQTAMQEANIQTAKGAHLALDCSRSTKSDGLGRYVDWNNRRKQRVLARLSGADLRDSE